MQQSKPSLPDPSLSAPLLPQLRQDIKIQRAPETSHDDQLWYIYDPVNHAYHGLNKKTLLILTHWAPVPEEVLIKIINDADKNNVANHINSDDIKKVTNFLHRHHLTQKSRSGNSVTFSNEYENNKKNSWKKFIHSYVFFRIPLARPQGFLNRYGYHFSIFFSPFFWAAMAGLALLSAYLTVRQWDLFTSTFFGFLSFEGLMGFTLAIVATKIAHEMGHAIAAHRYGCRVTSLGIGFMLMIPLLYTDTTDAWQITSRRKRLIIASSGMAAELIIATLATLIWHLLPDGSARSIFFFLATTSWIMTLLINLNPLMRFDGYYLLADSLNFTNMGTRANELGRWWLRELLFQPQEPCPENLPPRHHYGLLFFSYSVWIYRFFLFLGIALLLHAFTVKTIALVLAAIEIGWFIVRPIINEIREWPALIKRSSQKRKLVSMTIFGFFLLMFFAPWQRAIMIPAVIKPATTTTIFAHIPAQIDEVFVEPGSRIEKDAPIIRLRSPELTNEIILTEQEIALLEIRANRRASDIEERAQLQIVQSALKGAREKLTGLHDLHDRLLIRAPISGFIHGTTYGLHKDRWINPDLPLMHIAKMDKIHITAYVSEDDITRIRDGLAGKFYADDPLAPPVTMKIASIAPAGSHILEEPLLASTNGGAIATRENERGEIVPVRTLFRVLLESTAIMDRELRGTVRLKGSPRSPAALIWRRVIALINHESAN